MKDYIQTDQQIHWLSQTIAKANRTFVSKKDDDSNTNLYFDSLGNRIVGRWIETENGKILLTLNLVNLQFEWLNSSYKTVSSFKTIGKTIDAVEQEIVEDLGDLSLNPKGFTEKLHFEIPDYSFANYVVQPISTENLDEWKYFRNLANKSCSELHGYLQIEGEIRIWPHHFDTGIFVVTNAGMGIGFGLAMADTLLDEPYFYLTAYPESGSMEFTNLPFLEKGKWEIGERWKGAVLPLGELKQLSKEKRSSVVKDFLLKATNWVLSQK